MTPPRVPGKPGRPYLGPRHVVHIRVPEAVYEDVKRLADERGISPAAAIADILSNATGHPDLARDLTQEVLPLAM